jgi:hypothetical protein
MQEKGESMLIRKLTTMILFVCTVAIGPIAADSLIVTPAKPTTANSLTLTIDIPNWNCCMQYYHDSTLVGTLGDTALLLVYGYYQPQVCPMIACMDIDKLLNYHRGPLAAGKYSVYEAAQPYCGVGVPCQTLVAIPLKKIGEFTVTHSTAALVPARSIRSSVNSNAKMHAYDIRGRAVSSNALSRSQGISCVLIVSDGVCGAEKVMLP